MASPCWRRNVNDATAGNGWVALVALATAQFLMVLDQSVMNVSISALVQDFHTTVTTIQAVITLYCLLILTGAKMGDIIGRRRVVVIDWDDPTVAAALPGEVAVCAITLAELAAGPHLATSCSDGARRQARLQQVEATFEPLPFDTIAARSYGQIVPAVAETGQSHRRRMADLLIAATAHANGLVHYTRNPDDFAGLSDLVHVIGI